MPDVASGEDVKELKAEIKEEIKDLKQDIKREPENREWESRLNQLETKLTALEAHHSETMGQHSQHHAALGGLAKQIQEIRSLISDLAANQLANEAGLEAEEPEAEPPPVEVIEVRSPGEENRGDKNAHRWI